LRSSTVEKHSAPITIDADRTIQLRGRAGLTEQLKTAGWHGMHGQRMALLASLRQTASRPN
jgi:hypothetical protein